MQNLTLLVGLLSVSVSIQPSAADDAAFTGRYAAMLESGFGDSTSRLEEARRHYQAARSLRPDDPRVEYGFAIVLLKNFQQDEALTHVQAAIDAEPAYLPAWRVQCYELVREREYDALMDTLLTLSDVIGVISDDPPEPSRREEIAEWLGRAMGFLEGPLGDHDVAEQAVRVSRMLRARLGEPLLARFEAGRIAVSRQHQLLCSHQLAAAETARTARDVELEESQAARDQLDEQREQIEMTRDEWDAWIEEQVADIDSQLQALERQLGQARDEQQDINQAMLQVRVEILQITTLAEQAAGGQSLIAANPIILERQLIARQVELDRYTAEYNALEQDISRILAGAESLFHSRGASLTRYQRETGQAAERLQQIDRWDQRMERDVEQAERADLQDSQAVRVIRRRIQNWSTYEPFDLNAESHRLLAGFQAAAP